MAPLLKILIALAVASTIAANPLIQIRDSPITRPIAARWDRSAFKNIAEFERARVRQLIEAGKQCSALRNVEKRVAVTNVAITNTAVTYTVPVGIGCPATKYALLLDTGSANTWIGAGTSYKPTACSKPVGGSPGAPVTVNYGSGSFSGREFTDTVTIGTLVIKNQSIGVASTSSGFEGVDGILGLGPSDLTEGTVAGGGIVPSVVDNAFSEGLIPARQVGLFFEPATSAASVNGELTLGGADTSKTTGPLVFGSTTTSPADEFWGINQSIKYGTTTILATTAGIVDAGTTLILIATNGYNKYVSSTGATLDSATGLLKISSANFAKLQSMFFVVGTTSLEFTANAQLWPRSLNTFIGGTAGTDYLIIADLGSNSGQGLDFINGFTFLERYYSLYDTPNMRVGFAPTSFTFSTSN